MTGTVSALDPVDVLARTFERAHVPALFANAGRKEAPHTVPLPPGEVLDLAHCCSFRPAEQGIHSGCFRSLSESGFGLLSFVLRFRLGLLGRLDGSPDPFECDLSTRELLDRLDIRPGGPDRDQPLQRPRSRYCFPFVPACNRICSIETVCRDRRHDPVPCEMEWHPVLLLLAIATRAATPFIALQAPQCKRRSRFECWDLPQSLPEKDWIPVP